MYGYIWSCINFKCLFLVVGLRVFGTSPRRAVKRESENELERPEAEFECEKVELDPPAAVIVLTIQSLRLVLRHGAAAGTNLRKLYQLGGGRGGGVVVVGVNGGGGGGRCWGE